MVNGKKIVIFLVEILLFLSLGIMLVITFTGGFSFELGSLVVKAHTVKNPLIFLISILLLRTIFVGSVFNETLWLTVIQEIAAHTYIISAQLVRRLTESRWLKRGIMVSQLVFVIITVLIAINNPLKPGLLAQYYATTDWTGSPIKTIRERSLDLKYRREKIPAMKTYYSIQWTGVIFVPVTGEYKFTTGSDDGSELFLDNQRIVDNSGLHGLRPKSGTVRLEKGVHPIMIRYMQGVGTEWFEAYWTQPGKARELLSRAPLFLQKPKHLASFWIWSYRNVLPALLAFWGLVVIIFSLGVSLRISKKLPFWRAGIQGITLCMLLMIAAPVPYFLMNFPYNPYTFLQYFFSMLIVGLGTALLIGIAIAMVVELIRSFRRRKLKTGGGSETASNLTDLPQPPTKFLKYETIVVALLFLLFLVVGVSIFDDYGISYDETEARRDGLISVQYLLKENRQLLRDRERYHGPAFEMVLVALEKGFGLTDSREIYLMRHLVTFLVFYVSAFVFYLLCKARFRDWRIGVLGTVFLILSPRIFADAFYNSKDLTFLSVCILSIYTLIKYLDQQNWFRTFLHALLCGFLIDIRILGMLVPCLTILFMIGGALSGAKSAASLKRSVLSLVQYSLLLIGFTILFFPTLWDGPMYHFGQAFLEMKRFHYAGGVTYLGTHLPGTDIPWHYLPIWISITTPLLYVVTFLIGLFVLAKFLFKSSCDLYADPQIRLEMICVLWFFLPLMAVIGLKSVVYDAWRHVFYIYPAFLIIALNGLRSLFQGVMSLFKGQTSQIVRVVCLLLILLSLFGPTYFMVHNHPYQSVYFNQLAGKDMPTVRENFELDYWGLSYHQAVEYILQHDPREQIKLATPHFSVQAIALMFPPTERKRIITAASVDEADYFVTTYRDYQFTGDYPFEHEFYAIKIGGAKIVVVYDLHSATEKEKS